MAEATAHDSLRRALAPLPRYIAERFTNDELPAACASLGLAEPPAEASSKYKRAVASLADTTDQALLDVARRALMDGLLTAVERNEVEDALWGFEDHVVISKRVRREIAHTIDRDQLLHSDGNLLQLLDRIWVLDANPLDAFFNDSRGRRARIIRHFFNNPDWTVSNLIEEVDGWSATDRRFAAFLEGLVSADVTPSEPQQRALADTINSALRQTGAELREVGEADGYPLFAITSTRAHKGRAKNLIFASFEKPDLRFSDAIDNNVEIVSNEDKVLVYDRTIVTADGLRWRDLQQWWQQFQGIDETEAKRSLYKRLSACLPDSPPQKALFRLYHQIHQQNIPDLPALLPEVWLHWDPKTMRARGDNALPNSRMDFLLLFPHGRRVILEVDGQHHYATDGRPDPHAYAKMVCGDRARVLSGYEVYRFGAMELQDDEEARPMLEAFFRNLFALQQSPA